MIAIFATCITHKLLHELGHLFFFKSFGLEIVRVRLGFLEIFKKHDTPKVMIKYISTHEFSCSCKDFDLISKPKIITTLLAGGLLNLIIAIILIVHCIFVGFNQIGTFAFFQILWSMFDFCANVIYPNSPDRKLLRHLMYVKSNSF